MFDNTVAVEKAALVAQMPEPAVRAGSPAELAARIGVPADALERTVADWNAFLATGADRDPAFGRVVLPPGRRTCVTPPFIAVPMVLGVNFVSGGFRVTQSMQVIDVFGAPLRGLYAAGDCVGGLAATPELGGTRISGGFTLGRVAGEAAAAGTKDTHPRPTMQGASLPSRVDTKIALVNVPRS